MANVDMDRGDRIADLRKKHGWSQDEFADRVGIGRPAMSNIENGSDPKSSTLARIASVLDVTTDYILNGSCCEEKAETSYLVNAITSELSGMDEVELKRWLAMIQASKSIPA